MHRKARVAERALLLPPQQDEVHRDDCRHEQQQPQHFGPQPGHACAPRCCGNAAAGRELAPALAQVGEAQDRVDEIVVRRQLERVDARVARTRSGAPSRAPWPPPRSAGESRGRACRRRSARPSRHPARRACPDRAAPSPADRTGARRRRRAAARGARAARAQPGALMKSETTKISERRGAIA